MFEKRMIRRIAYNGGDVLVCISRKVTEIAVTEDCFPTALAEEIRRRLLPDSIEVQRGEAPDGALAGGEIVYTDVNLRPSEQLAELCDIVSGVYGSDVRVSKLGEEYEL